MSVHRPTFFLFLIFLLIVQLACSIPAGAGGTPDTAATLNGLYTASALTVAAQTGFTVTPGLPLPTPTGTSLPGFSTSTPLPPSVTRCDSATFIADVTVPDGTTFGRGASFTKTWRLKNSGTCTWTSAYRLVFISGDVLGGASVVSLPGTVGPSQTIDLSVSLTSPNSDGKYRGYWKLRNASNSLFGIGPQADTAFWVDIRVAGKSHVAYDFIANMCSADWENNNQALPCPGDEGDGKGYVIRLNHPKLENGSSQDDPGLLTVPRDSFNGLIRGEYPAFTVKSGDRFKAQVYCRHDAKKCNVIFRLDYLNNGKIRSLGSWHEAYEGKYYPVDVNLGNLAGETVKFILVVTANGSPNDDEAIWLNPHIQRQGTQPSSTPAPTKTRTPTPTATNPPVVSYKFDFGSVTSPLAGGYTRITEATAYTSGGAGWTDLSSLSSRDRATPDDLKRDLVQNDSSSARVFKFDLTNGNYSVTVTMGDNDFLHDDMLVKANGTTVLSDVDTGAGSFAQNTFSVTISGGTLELEFSDAGGSDPTWVVNGVVITAT